MIVGIREGKVSLATRDADSVSAVSRTPAALGNMPRKGEEHGFETIAFVGQVRVAVRGQVTAGDFIVPSGDDDGVGIAISPQHLTPDQFSLVVGQAWESSKAPEVKKVNTLVGMSPGSQAVANVVRAVQSQEKR